MPPSLTTTFVNQRLNLKKELRTHLKHMNQYLVAVRSEINKELARTYSGIATLDELIHSVPKKCPSDEDIESK